MTFNRNGAEVGGSFIRQNHQHSLTHINTHSVQDEIPCPGKKKLI